MPEVEAQSGVFLEQPSSYTDVLRQPSWVLLLVEELAEREFLETFSLVEISLGSSNFPATSRELRAGGSLQV